MSSKTTCDNPKCSCDPCTCGACKCGAGLGELERRVMEILWAEPSTSVSGRDVANQLPDYAYTTVATILERLVRKGFAHREMVGRTVRFTATTSRASHTASAMYEVLGTTADPDDALARFAETLSISEAEVLRQRLDDIERDRARSLR